MSYVRNTASSGPIKKLKRYEETGTEVLKKVYVIGYINGYTMDILQLLTGLKKKIHMKF